MESNILNQVDSPEISIVIPCFNEEDAITPVLDEVHAVMRGVGALIRGHCCG